MVTELSENTYADRGSKCSMNNQGTCKLVRTSQYIRLYSHVQTKLKTITGTFSIPICQLFLSPRAINVKVEERERVLWLEAGGIWHSRWSHLTLKPCLSVIP